MRPKLIVTLPLPPSCLSPNARPHYRKRHAAVAEYRGEAYVAAMAAAYEYDVQEPIAHPLVGVEYWHRTAKFVDADNILASLKAAMDGLTDAGIWRDDRQCAYLPVRREKDGNAPRVMLHVFEQSGQWRWWDEKESGLFLTR